MLEVENMNYVLNETLCPFIESMRLKFSTVDFVDEDCVVVGNKRF